MKTNKKLLIAVLFAGAGSAIAASPAMAQSSMSSSSIFGNPSSSDYDTIAQSEVQENTEDTITPKENTVPDTSNPDENEASEVPATEEENVSTETIEQDAPIIVENQDAEIIDTTAASVSEAVPITANEDTIAEDTESIPAQAASRGKVAADVDRDTIVPDDTDDGRILGSRRIFSSRNTPRDAERGAIAGSHGLFAPKDRDHIVDDRRSSRDNRHGSTVGSIFDKWFGRNKKTTPTPPSIPATSRTEEPDLPALTTTLRNGEVAVISPGFKGMTPSSHINEPSPVEENEKVDTNQIQDETIAKPSNNHKTTTSRKGVETSNNNNSNPSTTNPLTKTKETPKLTTTQAPKVTKKTTTTKQAPKVTKAPKTTTKMTDLSEIRETGSSLFSSSSRKTVTPPAWSHMSKKTEKPSVTEPDNSTEPSVKKPNVNVPNSARDEASREQDQVEKNPEKETTRPKTNGKNEGATVPEETKKPESPAGKPKTRVDVEEIGGRFHEKTVLVYPDGHEELQNYYIHDEDPRKNKETTTPAETKKPEGPVGEPTTRVDVEEINGKFHEKTILVYPNGYEKVKTHYVYNEDPRADKVVSVEDGGKDIIKTMQRPDGSTYIVKEPNNDYRETVTWTDSNGIKHVEKYDRDGKKREAWTEDQNGNRVDSNNIPKRGFTEEEKKKEREKLVQNARDAEAEKHRQEVIEDMKITPQYLTNEAHRQLKEWNDYRASKGLPTAEWNESVAYEARKWARKLAYEDRKPELDFYAMYPHERPFVRSGLDPNYEFNEIYGGENVWAANYDQFDKTVSRFINSPRHNANLLYNKRDERPQVGIGIVKGEKNLNGLPLYYIVYKITYQEWIDL